MLGASERGGRTAKIEVVGHGKDGKIGVLDAEQLARVVKNVSSASGTTVKKLTLVGCESQCQDGGSIVDEVKYMLAAKNGIDTVVKGYPTPIIVDELGHKQPVTAHTKGALGKDDPSEPKREEAGAVGGAVERVERVETELPARADTVTESFFSIAEQEGFITDQAASYLEYVKNKAADALHKGPVWFGEDHNSPFATLMLEQLLVEGAAKRVLIEQVPLRMQSIHGQSEATNVILKYKGFSSLDDYFSHPSAGEEATTFYKTARKRVADEFRELTGDYGGKLVAAAADSGVPFELIDGGRIEEEAREDDRFEFSLRNRYMARKITSDPANRSPGVVGVFGLEHLLKQASIDNTEEPALQQMVNIPGISVFQLTSMFHDYETGDDYFPWSGQGHTGNLQTDTSLQRPYKYTHAASMQAAGSAKLSVKVKNTQSHVVINAADDTALEHIEQIKNQHPATTIVFDALDGGGLSYVDGAGVDFGDVPTKVFLFTDPISQSAYTEDWLETASRKLMRSTDTFTTKEFYRSRQGQFKPGPKAFAEQSIVVNTSGGDRAADQAVERLVAKHPGTSSVFTTDAEGVFRWVNGALDQSGALTKVELVGRTSTDSNVNTLGGLDSTVIVAMVNELFSVDVTRIDKLTLVGCGAGCTLGTIGLADHVAGQFQALGIPTVVKGYETPITVDARGHKQPTSADAPDGAGQDPRPVASENDGAVGGVTKPKGDNPASNPPAKADSRSGSPWDEEIF